MGPPNLVNLKDFLGVEAKLKENIFKSNNQMNSTVTTRTWVLSMEWSVANCKISIGMKKW